MHRNEVCYEELRERVWKFYAKKLFELFAGGGIAVCEGKVPRPGCRDGLVVFDFCSGRLTGQKQA
jgi:hypothetical protein